LIEATEIPSKGSSVMSNVGSSGRRSTLPAARDFARRLPGQICLFPIKRNVKAPPLIANNLNRASQHDKQWQRWHDAHPGCNWGVSCPKSRLIVLDVDVRDGKPGANTLFDLEMRHGQLPTTLRVRTPSGGEHIYFAEANGVVHRHGQGVHGFGEGVDSTGYVLIPGSSVDGKSYTVINDAPIADAPEWFAEYLKEKEAAADADTDTPQVELDKPENIERAIHYLTNDAPSCVQGQNGEHTLLLVAGKLKDFGISEHMTVGLLAEHYNEQKCDPPWTIGDGPIEDRLDVKVHNAFAYLKDNAPGSDTAEADFDGDEPTDPPPQEAGPGHVKSVILVAPGQLPAVTRKLKALLIDDSAMTTCPASDKIFRRAGDSGPLVRLSRNVLSADDIAAAEVTGEVAHDADYHVADALLIRTIDKEWLADRAERTVMFGRIVKNKDGTIGKVRTDAPAKAIARLPVIYTKPDFARLNGVVETPTLRKDYSVLSTPGYDAQSRLFFEPGMTVFPAIPERPTKADARKALDLFIGEDGILCDFPFNDAQNEPKGLSRSVALAMLLTSVSRRSLETAPMFAVDAFEAQSGKTLLASLAGIMATGRLLAARPWPTDEYQRQNTLMMALEAGDPVLLYDNLGPEAPLDSEIFDAAITSGEMKARRLGSNSGVDEMHVPTNSTIVATGNHIVVAGDMAEGRVLISRIIPDRQLWQRAFRYSDLVEHVKDLRPQLVTAALTILRAYAVSPDHVQGVKFRHRQWRELIAASLIWLGQPDPALAEQRSKVTDPQREMDEDVTRKWAAAFGEQWKTTGELLGDPALKKTIAEWRGMKSDNVTFKEATPILRAMIGRRRLGFQVQQRPGDGKGQPARWRLKADASGGQVATEILEDAKRQQEAMEDFADADSDFGPA
jgi:Bifunctional DNA primase/polymerase, N-terminal